MLKIESNASDDCVYFNNALHDHCMFTLPMATNAANNIEITPYLQGHWETPRMEILRPNHRISRWMTAIGSATLCIALSIVGSLAVAQAPKADADAKADSRLATYETPAGDAYFAISVQPKLTPSQMAAITQGPRSVVIVADTSASQAGYYRNQTLDAVKSILNGLQEDVSVCIVAVDVRATRLSDQFSPSNAPATTSAYEMLAGRLPLGNTDLAAALRLGDELLSTRDGHRAMIYVGDGSSIGDVRDEQAFGQMTQALRDHQVAVHSLAIGPSKNVQLLASIANQTGGVTLVQSEDSKTSPQQMGLMVASAAKHSPLWVQAATLPAGFVSAHGDRLPPLRADRDAVILGRCKPAGTGALVLRTQAGQQQVDLTWNLQREPSHPDFAFLPALVTDSAQSNGLYLATAGSAFLRETARFMNRNADELAKAGALALKRGEAKGAAAVAEMALRIDPNNPQALSVSNLASNETKLTAQVAGAPPAGGSGLLDDAIPGITPDPLEAPSGLLDQVEAERSQLTGRVRAEVRAQLKAARQRMATDPTGIAGSLKILLQSIEAEPGLDVNVRDELAEQIIGAIQIAERAEIAFTERQSRQEEVKSQAATTERLLQDAFREEARVKTLVEQFASLMAEDRTAEAVFEVAPQVEEMRPGTVISNALNTHGHMVHNYRRWKKFQSMRQRNFVDALLLNEEAFIPFVDEPPLHYPDAGRHGRRHGWHGWWSRDGRRHGRHGRRHGWHGRRHGRVAAWVWAAVYVRRSR
jgi:hypothetical protein